MDYNEMKPGQEWVNITLSEIRLKSDQMKQMRFFVQCVHCGNDHVKCKTRRHSCKIAALWVKRQNKVTIIKGDHAKGQDLGKCYSRKITNFA